MLTVFSGCSFTLVTLYVLLWLCSLLSVSVSHVRSLSLDYILLISTGVFVPLFVLKCFSSSIIVECYTYNFAFLYSATLNKLV